MNYADIKEVDIQDGEGVRVSLYVSGCHFHCKGCHNKEAWDFNYGNKFTEETTKRILNLLDKNYITGLSILGGEPLEPSNQQGLVDLVKQVKQKFPDKTIWCWTGYDFEKDVFGKMYKEFPYTKQLLDNIDIIVDGQFEEENKLVNLKFRGSTNQKKIDVQASIKMGETVRLAFGDEQRYSKEKPKVISILEYKDKKENLNDNYISQIAQNNNILFDNEGQNAEIKIEKVMPKVAAKNNTDILQEDLK